MSEENKGSAWSFNSNRAVGGESQAVAEDGLAELETKPSAQYDVIQIAPVERFNVVFKTTQKLRLACWVLLRHKQTGEIVITGAVSPQAGSNGKLTLAIDLKDVDRFSPM